MFVTVHGEGATALTVNSPLVWDLRSRTLTPHYGCCRFLAGLVGMGAGVCHSLHDLPDAALQTDPRGLVCQPPSASPCPAVARRPPALPERVTDQSEQPSVAAQGREASDPRENGRHHPLAVGTVTSLQQRTETSRSVHLLLTWPLLDMRKSPVGTLGREPCPALLGGMAASDATAPQGSTCPLRSNSSRRGCGAGRGGAEGASLRPVGAPQTSEGPAHAPCRDSSGTRTSLLSSAEGRCPEGRCCLGIEGDWAERLLGKAARAAPSAEGPPAQPPCARTRHLHSLSSGLSSCHLFPFMMWKFSFRNCVFSSPLCFRGFRGLYGNKWYKHFTPFCVLKYRGPRRACDEHLELLQGEWISSAHAQSRRLF